MQLKQEAERNSKIKLVPEKYHDESTSGLSYEVVQGKQTHDIDLTQ